VEREHSVESAVPLDRYIDVGPVKTRYWAEGEGSAVVLIHGFADSVEAWSRVFGRFVARHRVYALDVVGAGKSGALPGSLPFPRLARFVRDFMDSVGVERAAVVGQSMGGGIALNLTLQYPERTERLVLVDSAGLGREMPIDFRLATVPVLGWVLTRTNHKQTARFLKKCFYDPGLVTGEMVDAFVEFGRLPGAHGAMLAWLRGNADLGGWRKDVVGPAVAALGTIEAPTLVIWGLQDRIIPVAHSRVAELGITGARVHIFDPCGHVPQVERADDFADVVLGFLGE
jgi:4,5:9,10-diseco-3-hydroxy-5,9,17-trioxoandrosta-1(10),2-diene-4-oate hydrolase